MPSAVLADTNLLLLKVDNLNEALGDSYAKTCVEIMWTTLY